MALILFLFFFFLFVYFLKLNIWILFYNFVQICFVIAKCNFLRSVHLATLTRMWCNVIELHTTMTDFRIVATYHKTILYQIANNIFFMSLDSSLPTKPKLNWASPTLFISFVNPYVPYHHDLTAFNYVSIRTENTVSKFSNRSPHIYIYICIILLFSWTFTYLWLSIKYNSRNYL